MPSWSIFPIGTSFSFLLLLLLFADPLESLTPCQEYAVCAVEKCVRFEANTSNAVYEEDLIAKMINRSNFGCVYGPSCYDLCMGCDSCRYIVEQTRNIVMDKDTDGECPDFESCTKGCLSDQVRTRSPWECFRKKCSVLCLDKQGCPPCFQTLKRIFAGFCYKEGYNWRFNMACKNLYEKVAENFMDKVRKRVA